MKRRMKAQIARRTINLPDYKARRLDYCNSQIIYFCSKLRMANTITEKNFCRDMIEMYVKRYNWYLR